MCLWLFYFRGEGLVFYYIFERGMIFSIYRELRWWIMMRIVDDFNIYIYKSFYYLFGNVVIRNLNGICEWLLFFFFYIMVVREW